jgi:hypothetical protein
VHKEELQGALLSIPEYDLRAPKPGLTGNQAPVPGQNPLPGPSNSNFALQYGKSNFQTIVRPDLSSRDVTIGVTNIDNIDIVSGFPKDILPADSKVSTLIVSAHGKYEGGNNPEIAYPRTTINKDFSVRYPVPFGTFFHASPLYKMAYNIEDFPYHTKIPADSGKGYYFNPTKLGETKEGTLPRQPSPLQPQGPLEHTLQRDEFDATGLYNPRVGETGVEVRTQMLGRFEKEGVDTVAEAIKRNRMVVAGAPADVVMIRPGVLISDAEIFKSIGIANKERGVAYKDVYLMACRVIEFEKMPDCFKFLREHFELTPDQYNSLIKTAATNQAVLREFQAYDPMGPNPGDFPVGSGVRDANPRSKRALLNEKPMLLLLTRQRYMSDGTVEPEMVVGFLSGSRVIPARRKPVPTIDSTN